MNNNNHKHGSDIPQENTLDFVKRVFKHTVDQPNAPISNHFLYVMRSIDLPGFIKIGISQNVGLRNARPNFDLYIDDESSRIMTNLTGYHKALKQDTIRQFWTPEVYRQFTFSDQPLARAFEMILHYKMRDYRLSGEFFYVGKQGMKLLDNLLADIAKFAQESLNETVDNDLDGLDDF